MDTKTNGANNWDLGHDSRGIIIDSAIIMERIHKIIFSWKPVYKTIYSFFI
jgi:hypothetical protein